MLKNKWDGAQIVFQSESSLVSYNVKAQKTFFISFTGAKEKLTSFR